MIDSDELEWYVPAAVLPSDLSESLSIINQFLENPIDLSGKKATQMLSKKVRRRKRRVPSEDPQSLSDEDASEKRSRNARKKKEQIQYKSAQFIEDSDAELGNDEEFFRREAALRERTSLAATQGPHLTMRPTGTKKRKKGVGENKRERKKRKSSAAPETNEPGESYDSSGAGSSIDSEDEEDEGGRPDKSSEGPASKFKVRPKPKPKPKAKATRDLPTENVPIPSFPSHESGKSRKDSPHMDDDDSASNSDLPVPTRFQRRRKITAMLSDEEE